MVGSALAILMVLLALAVPVAAALGFLGIALSELYSRLPLTLAMGEVAWATSNNFLLVAIPFFVLLGEILLRSGIAERMYNALVLWVPSIAPSGMTFYTGERFPKWRGNLFVGSLKFQLLSRLELDGEKIVKEERLIQGELGRIRDVRTGPDGYIYLLTDAPDGVLARIEPAN